jgi:ribosomal protein L11 methyltransferase
VPYRIDLTGPPADALDTLVELGALDVESTAGGLAALMPDAVPPIDVANALRTPDLRTSPAVGRDDESVWTLSPRPVRMRTLLIVPASAPVTVGALRIIDGPAFGTGLHPTTVLCLEALEAVLDGVMPARVLDVGTGSGILALAALHRGVPRAVGVDMDGDALRVAAESARLNGLATRLSLVRGGPGALRGGWPLVLANIRAAELIELASTLVRRVSSGGRLVLSGIPSAVAAEVAEAYRRLGMKQVGNDARGGWTALVLVPSW